MKEQIGELVQKEMTRKEFLTTVGFGVVSIMGFSSLLKLLTGKSHSLKRNLSDGYGSSAYGGSKN